MARLPHRRRRTERSADFAVLRSMHSSTTTKPAPRSRNSSNASVSAAPPSRPTSTAEVSNDAPSRSSGTPRNSPPPLAATQTVPRSRRSPRDSDAIRQPSPTASAEQASRSDPDEDGIDRPTNTSERDPGSIPHKPRRPAGSSSRVSPTRTYATVLTASVACYWVARSGTPSSWPRATRAVVLARWDEVRLMPVPATVGLAGWSLWEFRGATDGAIWRARLTLRRDERDQRP